MPADALPPRGTTGRALVGRVVSVNVSNGGVPKWPVPEAPVAAEGVGGDRQRDRRFHGGPARAVSIYSMDLIRTLNAEGHPIAPGTTGENVTVEGIDWSLVLPGARLRLGGVLVEVTSFATPCRNIRPSFSDADSTRISEKLHPGWSRAYARVLEPGTVRTGDAVELTPAP